MFLVLWHKYHTAKLHLAWYVGMDLLAWVVIVGGVSGGMSFSVVLGLAANDGVTCYSESNCWQKYNAVKLVDVSGIILASLLT